MGFLQSMALEGRKLRLLKLDAELLLYLNI